MSVIGAIQKHIEEKCPLLSNFTEGLGVDYLEENATAYMIEPEPAKAVVKSYIDGSSDKQCVFSFCSRDYYGPDNLQNLNNLGFYEDFSDWLRNCTEEKNLPTLGENKQSLKYEVLTQGYLHHAQAGKAQYRIQCRLVYFEERK